MNLANKWSALVAASLGSAADLYGLRRFYLGGVAVYTFAVLLIGLADETLSGVFALRVLQAVGNGLILAAAPGLVTRSFPAEERGRALGLMAAIATLGLITGSIGACWSIRSAGRPSSSRACRCVSRRSGSRSSR